jgi:dihydropyrimidinase
MNKLVIKGGILVNQDGIREADILIEGEKIISIQQEIQVENTQVIDAQGKLVLPGGIDVHVHLPWPTGSYISSDDFFSGTRAAAFGGVTTIIDYVIPVEEESLGDALKRKQEKAQTDAWVDYSFHITVRGDISKKIPEIQKLVKAGFPSFKVFLAYEGFRLPDKDILETMKAVKEAGGMLVVHAENGFLADYLTRELINDDKVALKYYPQSRPALCETEAIQRVLVYAQTIGTKVHFHHVSTGLGAAMINDARRKGLPVSGETCPHYLIFSDEDYAGDPSKAASLVCAPLIKSPTDRQALWEAIANDSLSVVATDHCPYTVEQKEANLDDFTKVPGGMAGVETRLPILYSEGVIKERISLTRFVQLWSTEPAKIFGLYPQKGILAVGSDADITIIDPDRKSVLRAENTHMNTDCLPYEGLEMAGIPETTILRGNPIVLSGDLQNKNPQGVLVHRTT